MPFQLQRTEVTISDGRRLFFYEFEDDGALLESTLRIGSGEPDQPAVPPVPESEHV